MKEKELIKELWTLWEALSEAGEIKMSYKFPNKYLELKKEIEHHTKKQSQFIKLLSEQEHIDPEFVKIVSDNFNDLLA